MSTNSHYFFAVRLADTVKQVIHDNIMDLTSIFQFKRWVHMEDYHITLAFLGLVEEDRLSSVIQLVGDAIKEENSFPLHVEGLDIFGNKQSPRIFWASVKNESKLYRLQEAVYRQCIEAGFTLESRPYHPHITLARKWGADSEFTLEMLERYNPFRETPVSFQVNEVVLYKTNIEKTPKYEPIASFLMK